MKVTAIDMNDNTMMDEFIDLPWRIYPEKHPWVPPLKSTIRNELSKENLFFTHGEAQPFICTDNGNVIGRIVAAIDNLIDDRIGYFGYFETVDNADAAHILLEAAESWLKEKGKKIIQGPVNLNIFYGYRLMIEGHDMEPYLGEPRAPQYYNDLITNNNYNVHQQWYSYDIDIEKIRKMFEQYKDIPEEFYGEDNSKFHKEYLDFKKFREELEDLYPVIFSSWKDNYGFSWIPFDEFHQVFSWMQYVTVPEGFAKIYNGETPIGFGVGYFDYSEFFQEINGDDSKIQGLFQYEPETAIFYSFGILEEYRKNSAAYILPYLGVHYLIENNFKRLIASLVKEGNSIYKTIGLNHSRSYVIFEKNL